MEGTTNSRGGVPDSGVRDTGPNDGFLANLDKHKCLVPADGACSGSDDRTWGRMRAGDLDCRDHRVDRELSLAGGFPHVYGGKCRIHILLRIGGGDLAAGAED